MPKITIDGQAAPVVAGDGETILAALKRAGVAVGYSCESGKCGTCKCVLLSGAPVELDHADFALSDAQHARGVILACRSRAVGDVRIRILDADELVVHPIRDMRCRLIELSKLTHDIWRLVFGIESGGPFVFSAGQYAKIEFQTAGGETLLRDFSIANAPLASVNQGLIEFHIRAAPGGSFTRVIESGALSVGSALRVTGPEGTSYLRPAFAGPMLLVAGGSGLAPILSILESAIDHGMPQPMHVYVGARDERDVYGEAQLRALATRAPALRFEYVLSAPTSATTRRIGLVTDAIAADIPDASAMKAYLAGPPVMVEAAARLLLARGLTEHDLHTDAYYTAPELAGASVNTSVTRPLA